MRDFIQKYYFVRIFHDNEFSFSHSFIPPRRYFPWVVYTKDVVNGVCFGILFILMFGTMIVLQIYISRLEDVNKKVESLIALTDESHHARLCSQTGNPEKKITKKSEKFFLKR